METKCTLINVLNTAAAKSAGSDKGITFYDSAGEKKITYMDLMKESLETAGGIIDAGVSEDFFVVLQIKDPQLFIKGFWSSMICGAIPVPLTVDDKKGLNIEKLVNVTKSMDRYIILTESVYYEEMKHLFPNKNMIFNIEKLSGVPLDMPVDSGNDKKIAYIQFSSGSTSNPKGVCLTHQNIVSNIQSLIKRMGQEDSNQEDVVMNWVPLTHNMGLIGFHIMPLFQCIDQHILTPAYLIQNTEYVLQLIKTKGINTFACPNFLIKLLLSKLSDELVEKLDFSHVKSIHLGAEPISPSLVRQFTGRLKNCGLNEKTIACSYGLAESAMLISHQCRNEGLKTIQHEGKEIVLNGLPMDGTTVYTIDEQGHMLKEGVPGELVVKSASVMQGYLGIEPDADLKEGILKTGDIGIVTSKGIAVFGRMKDMIIINAKNFYTTDIELEIEKRTGITSEAFVITSSLDSDSNETIKLYVLQEVYERQPECIKTAEAAFEIYTGSRLAEIFIVNEIPRTASGKKQRFQMNHIVNKKKIGDKIETDNLPPSSPLEIKIASIWEKVLNVKVGDIHTSFFKMGGDSLTAMDCIVQLKKEGFAITPEQFYSAPSVDGLAHQAERGLIPIMSEQNVNSGKTVPLPSHHKLLADKFLYQWNLGVILDIKPLPSLELLKDIMRALLTQQDGLRHRFTLDHDTVTEWISDIEDCIFVDHIYYDRPENLKYYIECFQSTLDLNTYPFKFIVLQKKGTTHGKLMILLHHALGDAYSMRLLMNDFIDIYDVIAVQKKHFIPKKKATSLRQWEKMVYAFAQSESCAKDLAYWRDVCSTNADIPCDFKKETGNNRMIYEKIHTFLLPQAGKIKNKEDLQYKLLAAWFQTLSQWSGKEHVDVMYTLNGRSGIEADIPYDLSSTIGWIAFLVPVKAAVANLSSPEDMVRQIKQEINGIPHGGISYGCLKYLKNDDVINSYPLPCTSFNYYNMDTKEEAYNKENHKITPSKEIIDTLQHPYKQREHIIDLVIIRTENNEFHARIHYSCKIHKEETIKHLAQSYENIVEQFVKGS